MTMRLAVLVALALALAPPGARAQLPAGTAHADDQGKPINIEAQLGIEWQQDNRVYIARGNVKATRGQGTLYCDTLYAFYRPVKPAPAGAKPAGKSGNPDPTDEGATEVYRLEADGHVRLVTDTHTVYGDHVVYDIDRAVAVITGKALKLVTATDVVTARDSFEWYDRDQLAVARGDAVATRKDRNIRADVLTAIVEKPQNGKPSHISRVNADGHVQVATVDQIARGDVGVYNADTDIATLTGNVTLTKGDTELKGEYAVVDLNRNIGHVQSTAPNEKVAQVRLADPSAFGPVKVLVQPRSKPAVGKPARATLNTSAGKPAPAAPAPKTP
jgi:lipopolysaccharide export system protein LptA